MKFSELTECPFCGWDEYTEHKSYELCPGCLTYLQDWVAMGKKEEENA